MSDGFGQRGFVKHGSAPGAAAAEAWPVAGAIGRKETVLFATEDVTGPR